MAATIAVLATLAVSPVSQSAESSGSALAAGHCSKAAAGQVVRELGMAEPGLASPVTQVLCGAFLGPGVEAMAASVAIPSCGRTANWLVFRYRSGGWRRVFESHNGAVLAAVGSDIKETQNVLRDGDAHCFPTGGTRSRVWHWNGSRFTSSAWKYSKSAAERAAKPLKLFYFFSPSGYAVGSNIFCSSGDGGLARCMSNTPRRSATLKLDGTLKICQLGLRWWNVGRRQPNTGLRPGERARRLPLQVGAGRDHLHGDTRRAGRREGFPDQPQRQHRPSRLAHLLPPLGADQMSQRTGGI